MYGISSEPCKRTYRHCKCGRRKSGWSDNRSVTKYTYFIDAYQRFNRPGGRGEGYERCQTDYPFPYSQIYGHTIYGIVLLY